MKTMKTKRAIEYRLCPMGKVTIPAGTKVIPASNLPDTDTPQYWAEPWKGMNDFEESWGRNYGFLLTRDDIK